MSTPRRLDVESKAVQMKRRLENCWEIDIDWELYPRHLLVGFEQLGKSFDVPPIAVLSGVMSIMSYCLSHCVIEVPGTEWVEPSLLWLSICMPTGSGKTPLFSYLTNLLKRVQLKCKEASSQGESVWLLDEASFEKMGAIMATNSNKLLGLYDELSTFLSQINVYRGKGLSESHDFATFLSLYNAKSWMRATVSGEANFNMPVTGLTVAGFTQPTVARTLLEMPPAIEKGLVQRFLWIIPKPSFAPFSSLESANKDFTDYLVEKLHQLQCSEELIRLSIPPSSEIFQKKFDDLQNKISKLSVYDELLAGMLSKAKGQILRVAGILNVLFCDRYEDGLIHPNENIPIVITNAALKAAQDFVDTACQQAAYLSGRGLIEKEIQRFSVEIPHTVSCQQLSNQTFCLLLPGSVLDLSSLLQSKKFRARGNKDGALAAMRALEADGLGKLLERGSHRGTSVVYKFEKAVIPRDNIEDFATKLSKYGVSLQDYQNSYTSVKEPLQSTPQKRPREDSAQTTQE